MDDAARVKQKLDIADFINEFVPLKKAGRNFKANCPFHSEKSPSFVVSPDRQIFHCFGCGKGGDIFSFVEEYERIEFAEALKYLAGRAGIKLQTPTFRTENERKRDLFFTLNHLAAQFYHYLLTSHKAGNAALSYLENERKLSPQLIDFFNLGYAPSKDAALSDYLVKKKQYKAEDIIEAGLAFRGRGGLVDFFRNRIIFPLLDTRGNIIAFSGRALDNVTQPKYINTKETILYKKRENLFGVFQAKDAMKKEDKALVVEGEFDVITSHKEGIGNVVAVKGTALTEEQLMLLKRFATKILFCFDTDPAGSEAQKRSIELIEKLGMSAGVVVLPEGKDPDELLKSNPLLFKKAVKNFVNIYDYIIDSAVQQFDTHSADGKDQILKSTLPILSPIENEVVKEHYFKKLSGLLDASLESIQKQARKNKNPIIKAPKETPQKQQSREEILERYLLALLFQSNTPKASLDLIREALFHIPFSNPATTRLLKYYDEYISSKDTLDPSEFTNTIPPELIERFDTVFIQPLPEFSDIVAYNKELDRTVRDAKQLCIKKRLVEIGQKIKDSEASGDEKRVEELEQEFAALTQLLK